MALVAHAVANGQQDDDGHRMQHPPAWVEKGKRTVVFADSSSQCMHDLHLRKLSMGERA